MTPRHAAALTFGVLLVVLSLPLAEWWPGALGIPNFAAIVSQWLLWALISAGFSTIAVLVARRGPLLAGLRAAVRAAGSDAALWRTTCVVALVALLCYAAVAYFVFSARPIIIDELVQAFQARQFAAGRLYDVAPRFPEFTSALNVVTWQGRVFGHFPPGGPAVLAIGELVGFRWLAVPMIGAVGVLAFGMLVRSVEQDASTRTLALLVWAFAPFMVFMAGTQLNHTTLATVEVAALAFLAHAVRDQRRSHFVLAGVLMGLAATVRPLDAALLAVSLGGWLLWRTRDSGLRELVPWSAGVLIGGSVLLLYNTATTGAPLLLGYRVLWGPDVGLGFHDAPWGESFTFQIGLERTNTYVLQLQSAFLESGMPALLPAMAALLFWRRRPLAPIEGAWAVAMIGTLVAYTCYWHNGSYLGPRFLHVLTPFLALWTARGLRLAAGEASSASSRRPIVIGAGLAVGLCAAVLLPDRVRDYSRILETTRRDLGQYASAAGVSSGTVFVHESWGAQVIARLWALGVPNWTTERLYRSVDLCRLDQAVRGLEARGVPVGPVQLAALDGLRRDSLRLRAAPFTADSSPRWDPSMPYDTPCRQAIIDDRAGIAVAAPERLAGSTEVVWARDLGARNARAEAELPKPWWRLESPPEGAWRIVPYQP